MELRETPCLQLIHTHKDVGRPQGQRDMGMYNEENGPLGEDSPHGTGVGRGCRRGSHGGKGFQGRQRGGVWYSMKIIQYGDFREALTSCMLGN